MCDLFRWIFLTDSPFSWNQRWCPGVTRQPSDQPAAHLTRLGYITWFWWWMTRFRWQFWGNQIIFNRDIIKISVRFSNLGSFCVLRLLFWYYYSHALLFTIWKVRNKGKISIEIQLLFFFPWSPCTHRCLWFLHLYLRFCMEECSEPHLSPYPLLFLVHRPGHPALAAPLQLFVAARWGQRCQRLTWLVPPTSHHCSEGSRQRAGDKKQQQLNLQPF